MGVRNRLKRLGRALLDRPDEPSAPPPPLREVGRPTPVTPVPTASGAPTTGFAALARAAAEGASAPAPDPIPSVDNESTRAAAGGETLDIDRDECIGCGTCVEHTDTVFWLDDDEGLAWVLSQDGNMRDVQDAIDACPVACIHWTPTPRDEPLPPHAPVL